MTVCRISAAVTREEMGGDSRSSVAEIEIVCSKGILSSCRASSGVTALLEPDSEPVSGESIGRSSKL
jgi:hypothetical protein